MNELKSHADVENFRKKTNRTNAWDFMICGGDTIKEKFQTLHDIVSNNCLRKNSSSDVAFVIANEQVSSFLNVYHNGDDSIYKNEKLDDITFVGEFYRSCGDNGYNTNFNLYKDDKMNNDEIVVVKGDNVSIIKLFNYPF